MRKHALLAPSAADKWMNCAVSVGLENLLPHEQSSIYADEGTFAHEILAEALESGKDAEEYLGRKRTINDVEFEVDIDMANSIQMFIDHIQHFGSNRMIEKTISLTSVTGEENAVCTPDTVIFHKDEMIIADFKYGKGVSVSAQEKYQLIIYALAALNTYSYVQDTRQVRMIIIQPRLNNIDEYVLTKEEILEKVVEVRNAARKALGFAKAIEGGHKIPLSQYSPGEKQCRFCKAKARCPALADRVITLSGLDFNFMMIEEVALLYGQVNLIEDWCNAIREEVRKNLDQGNAVPGYRLVEGKLGPRKWSDDKKAAEVLIETFGDEQVWKKTLVSPTEVERFIKARKLDKEVMESLDPFITRSPGRPTIVEEDDKRANFKRVASADDFEDLGEVAA